MPKEAIKRGLAHAMPGIILLTLCLGINALL